MADVPGHSGPGSTARPSSSGELVRIAEDAARAGCRAGAVAGLSDLAGGSGHSQLARAAQALLATLADVAHRDDDRPG